MWMAALHFHEQCEGGFPLFRLGDITYARNEKKSISQFATVSCFFFRLASCRDATFDFIFTFLIVDANNSQTQAINNGIFNACVSCKYDTAFLFWLKVL